MEKLRIDKALRVSDYLEILLLLVIVFGYFGPLRGNSKYIMIAFLIVTITNNFSTKINVKSTVFRSWGLVCVLLLFSALTSSFIAEGLWYVVVLLSGLSVSAFRRSQRYYKLLFKCFSITAVVFAVVTVLSAMNPYIVVDNLRFFIGSNQADALMYWSARGVYYGLAREISFNAFCLSIGIAIFTAEIIVDKRGSAKNKFFYSVLVVLLYLGIILTQKRSFILIISSVMLIFFAISSQKGRLRNTLFFVAFIGAFFTVISNIMPDSLAFWDRMVSDGGGLYLSGREWYWNHALEIFREKPLFGSGINTYDAVNNAANYYSGFKGAHNSYYQFLAELGLVGESVLLAVVVYTLYKSIKILRQVKKNKLQEMLFLMNVSIFIQLTCLTYALSGNPFHELQQLFTYAISVGIIVFAEIARGQSLAAMDTKLNS